MTTLTMVLIGIWGMCLVVIAGTWWSYARKAARRRVERERETVRRYVVLRQESIRRGARRFPDVDTPYVKMKGNTGSERYFRPATPSDDGIATIMGAVIGSSMDASGSASSVSCDTSGGVDAGCGGIS